MNITNRTLGKRLILRVIMGALYWSIFMLGSFVILGELLDKQVTQPTLFWAKLLFPGGILVAAAVVFEKSIREKKATQ